MHVLIINLISILGLFGFLISFYIYSKKNAKKKLICPRRSNCDTVIHSDYSRILGIPVEVLGMIYYVIIGSAYTILFVTNNWSIEVAQILLGLSMASVLFSIYLVSVQIFILRHWCIWCLSSALASVLIAVLSYIHFISY